MQSKKFFKIELHVCIILTNQHFICLAPLMLFAYRQTTNIHSSTFLTHLYVLFRK